MKDRRYVLLRRNKKTGEISGLCENSFSMSFEPNRVKVYGCVMKLGEKQSEEYYQYYLNNQKRYKGIRKAKSPNQKLWYELRLSVLGYRESDKKHLYEYKVFRVGKNCPVDVDFSEFELMKSKKMKNDKYLWRNQPIKAVYPDKW